MIQASLYGTITADSKVSIPQLVIRLSCTHSPPVDREALVDIPNVYNYQSFLETDRAGYIVRQWIASNLYDRIRCVVVNCSDISFQTMQLPSTRPFLSVIEKKWIAFQVLTALRDARNRKVSHGDIKSENILVTSWNWVYLSEFASFKPTYLPLDDPSEFSYFFDTSGRRTCYVAPERFYTAANNPEISAKKSRIAMDDNEGKRDGKLTEAMDCFSAGCVIAELFLEAPLFTLSQLFKYREGEYNVDGLLGTIEDEGIRVSNIVFVFIYLVLFRTVERYKGNDKPRPIGSTDIRYTSAHLARRSLSRSLFQLPP